MGVEITFDQSVGGFCDDDLARVCGLLKARRDIGRVADGRVVHPQVTPDAANHNEAGVEPLPDVQGQTPGAEEIALVLCERFLNPKACMDGPNRVVLVRNGGAKQGHDPVPQELVDGPLIAMNLDEHELEGSRHHPMDILRIEPFGQGGESRHVHEQHGDLLALALQRALEPPRLSRRLHFLRGWGPWERRTGTHRKCGNARYGWSGSIKPSTRRSGRRSSRSRRRSAARPRRYGTGSARPSGMRTSARG